MEPFGRNGPVQNVFNNYFGTTVFEKAQIISIYKKRYEVPHLVHIPTYRLSVGHSGYCAH